MWSSTTRSAARTLSQTEASTAVVGRLVVAGILRGTSGPSTATKTSDSEMSVAARAKR